VRAIGFSFVLNGTIYFGGGTSTDFLANLKDFYAVNPLNGAVTRLPDMDDDATVAMFTINGKGYRLNTTSFPVGGTHELYEFDVMNNRWTKRASFATVISDVLPFESNGTGFLATMTNAGWDGQYNAGSIELWSYNAGSDKWTKEKGYVARADYNYGIVSANGKTYLLHSLTDEALNTSSTSFMEFDPVAKTFLTPSFSTAIPFNAVGSFSALDKGYVFSRSYLWKFDPAL
jgi:hypothetical protein